MDPGNCRVRPEGSGKACELVSIIEVSKEIVVEGSDHEGGNGVEERDGVVIDVEVEGDGVIIDVEEGDGVIIDVEEGDGVIIDVEVDVEGGGVVLDVGVDIEGGEVGIAVGLDVEGGGAGTFVSFSASISLTCASHVVEFKGHPWPFPR